MDTSTMDSAALDSRRKRRRRIERLLILGIPSLLLLPVVAIAVRPAIARHQYTPAEGDVVFQPLPRGKLVGAIEGATRSPFSHCGLVGRENGKWVVYEAFDGVECTPLAQWLKRGRGGAFAAYRLKSPQRVHIPPMLATVRQWLGRPYDERYRLGDAELYCSELVFLAYREAANEPLGKTVRLRELDWKPHQALIEQIEGGPAPLEREIITPRDLAAAEQLEQVCRFGL